MFVVRERRREEEEIDGQEDRASHGWQHTLLIKIIRARHRQDSW